MIRKSKGEFVAICTECETEEYGGVEDDFQKFVQQLKDAGWQIKKVDEEWQHFCPECRD